MYVSDLSNAPKREIEGLVAHILLQEGDAPGGELSITWVEVQPGAQQPPAHPWAAAGLRDHERIRPDEGRGR